MSFFTTLIPNRVRAVRNGSAEGAAAPTVKPYYEVQETDDAYSVTVYLPGVTKENLEITVEADEFRVSGRRAWKQPEGWAPLHRESADEAFELVAERRGPDGRGVLENSYNERMLVPIERQGEASNWITLNALRSLSRRDGKGHAGGR